VEVMGGEISVESEKGQGSIFRFNLKLNKTAQAEGEAQSMSFLISRKSTLQGINILLAEDNNANQILIKKFLNRWGARVDTASNGEEAVNKIKKKKYDLLLLDMQMPVMDGYQASTAIRAMGYNMQDLPIIAITAYAMAEDKVQVLNHGMNDYISKPINPEEMHQKILKNISRKIALAENDLQGDPTNLKSLIESFKDEPEFIRRYLSEYENEFTQLPLHAKDISEKKDVEELERLIHKASSSIQRTEHPLLKKQLDNLKAMLSDKEPIDGSIFQLTSDIQKSCEDVIAQIKTLQEEYLGDEAFKN
jgi:CheY-like chemotaxis protein